MKNIKNIESKPLDNIMYKNFNTYLKDYRPIPFWSWNNELDIGELRKQINEMNSAGIGGFIMHARTGLKTKYLSDEWFECIKACLKEARKLDMNAWIYDENGWPSGFVEGRLLKNLEYRANYLEYRVKNEYDDNAFAVYQLNGDKATRIYNDCKAEKYHCVYLKTSPANTDILNPVVVDEFIKHTHEEYYNRFGDSFGKELKGFFTDEPQYYRWATPFTKQIITDYFNLYKEDIKDYLIYLFIKSNQGHKFRYRYYSLLNNYYVNNYYKKIYDWCENHNCMLTGHSVEEGYLYSQMWGGAGVMPTYEYQHIPGIDFLGRNCGRELLPKQVSSVAEQLGKKFVLTETFGCSGYDVTPIELRSIAEYQYFNGVNLMCHHLLPYSIAGQGKYDHPPVFSKHSNWWEEFKDFNDYFTQLGYIIANTKEITDIAIINPMKSIYLEYIRDLDYSSVKEIEDNYRNLLQKLRKNGILYQIIDENILEKYGKVNNGELVVGKKSYNTVVLPFVYTLSESTHNILTDYVNDNGMLCALTIPQNVEGKENKTGLFSTISFDEIIKKRHIESVEISDNVFITSRKGEIGEFIFIKNLSSTEKGYAQIKGVSGKFVEMDLVEKTFYKTEDNLTVLPNGSVILYKKKSDIQKHNYIEKDVTNSLYFNNISDNFLIIDKAAVSYDGKEYCQYKDTQQIFEELLRKDYKGELFVKYKFIIKDMPESLILLIEDSHYENIIINNSIITLKQSDFDIKFKECNILPYITIGENEILYKINYYQHDGVSFALFDPEATESLRNCLYYDTEIERIYLKGKFFVNNDLSLSNKVSTIPICENIQDKGYPFFCGSVSYSFDYDYNCGKVLLQIEGRFMVANITINGHKCNIVLDDKKDITEYLIKGKNSITITIKSSLRNLLGPHHYKHQKEPLSVSPYLFTQRGSWGKGISADYTSEYNLVNYGLKSVKIYEERT
jgi:hypothetical protein